MRHQTLVGWGETKVMRYFTIERSDWLHQISVRNHYVVRYYMVSGVTVYSYKTIL